MIDQARFQEQVDRLAASQTLHGSESLCKLLQYLANHAIENSGLPLKEYQIATELYGRPSDFDPQIDSMVRVRAGRLRVKLSEYYASEGSKDPIILDLPKGAYLLKAYPRVEPSSGINGASSASERLANTASVSRRTFLTTVIALSGLLALSLFGIYASLVRRKPARENRVQAPPSLTIFWQGFEKGPEAPWVVFSNAAFVGRPDLGLRYYNAKRDAKSVIFDHYTGVGEVLGVHALDTAFTQLGGKIRVKRGSLFTLDDAKNNDLIFIGSPSENLSLLDIPGSHEFRFQSVPAGPRKGNMEILNIHPQPGELSEFLASPSNVPLTEDFAVIALTKGLDHEHSVLVLAGTTTLGTQAAVEFVSAGDALQLLLARLSVSSPAGLTPFEALIHVKVARGVPVESELVAVRKTGS